MTLILNIISIILILYCLSRLTNYWGFMATERELLKATKEVRAQSAERHNAYMEKIQVETEILRKKLEELKKFDNED